MMIAKELVLKTLENFIPADKISGVVINGANIGFALESGDENLRKSAEKAVFALHGVEKVTAVLTGSTGKISVENKGEAPLNRKEPIAGVKRIIAVASGKGGVGKSTIALSLARAAAKAGKKVGLVDADIYGPSLAYMLGLRAKPDVVDNLMIPIMAEGILCNSMGILLGESQPAIWRGPMATKAIHQLFKLTKWDVNGELDVLFIDMPPGTGDIHLTIAQHYVIDGAVLITTPQELALLDVRKAAAMFERVDIPILGMIENMSYFIDPESGNKSYIFGQNGGANLAQELGLKLLAEVPLINGVGEQINLDRVFEALLK
jgi:ATP-binding protein involved in chromosome partitioning